MRLEETIRGMILRYPTIFPNRAAALDHLYCTIGNGYHWVDGEICAKEPIVPVEQLRREDLKLIQSQFAHIGVSQRKIDQYLKQERDMYAYIDEHIEDLCLNNDLYWDPPWRKKDSARQLGFYPLCEYSLICKIPPDAKPDWIAGAKEVCNLIIALPEPESEQNKTVAHSVMAQLAERV